MEGLLQSAPGLTSLAAREATGCTRRLRAAKASSRSRPSGKSYSSAPVIVSCEAGKGVTHEPVRHLGALLASAAASRYNSTGLVLYLEAHGDSYVDWVETMKGLCVCPALPRLARHLNIGQPPLLQEDEYTRLMRIVEENATQPLPTLVAPPVVMEDPVQKAEAPMSVPARQIPVRQIPVRQTSPAPAVSAPPAVATLAASGAVALAVAVVATMICSEPAMVNRGSSRRSPPATCVTGCVCVLNLSQRAGGGLS
eukprot:4174762-Pyramimonas_sp.AAC.2